MPHSDRQAPEGSPLSGEPSRNLGHFALWLLQKFGIFLIGFECPLSPHRIFPLLRTVRVVNLACAGTLLLSPRRIVISACEGRDTEIEKQRIRALRAQVFGTSQKSPATNRHNHLPCRTTSSHDERHAAGFPRVCCSQGIRAIGHRAIPSARLHVHRR